VETKVMLTHKPSGIVITCQKDRSQLGNRELAMQMLRAKLYEIELNKHLESVSKRRKTMVTTGDRSEKIRTYNSLQDRVTDHRIKESWHNLPGIFAGNVGGILDALEVASQNPEMVAGTSEA
jgi:peptide chain release factor 1